MSRRAKNTRMCIGCRQCFNKSSFFSVNSYKGDISLNLSGEERDGRAVYLCKNMSCLEKAVKRKAFSRQLKCEVSTRYVDELREHILAFNME